MNNYSFVNFLTDTLPTGIISLRCIRRDGFAIGRYLLDECPGAILGAPHLTLVQHEGEPFTLHWQPLDHRYPTRHWAQRGQIHLSPPECIFNVAWPGRQQVFLVAMGVDFVTRSVALDGPDKLGGMQAHLDIRDTGIANILDILKEALEQSEQGASLALACALLAGRLCETFGGKLSRPPSAAGLAFHGSGGCFPSLRLICTKT